MEILLLIAMVTAGGLLVGAGVLHLLPQELSAWCCRAPGVDLVLAYFMLLPWIMGPIMAGWMGLLAAISGQVVGLVIWMRAHELAHLDAKRGPRIDRTLGRMMGRMRNVTAVWVTAFATPVFWFVRFAEVFVYPPLTWLIRLPKYDHGDWVAVSRHKFDGLVGSDLIWCLYCDWMTGVWSLGSEMLRNVESFWCPIRFRSDKKCANCVVDFPDIDNGWVDAQGSMADVVKVLEQKYAPEGGDANGDNSWFGHPQRVTIEGERID